MVPTLLLFSACAPAPTVGHSAPDAPEAADTAGTRDTSPPHDTAGDPDGLVGTPVDPPLDPPEFLVENQRREARTPDWLVGDPAVLWFFRDAGST